MGNLLSVFFLFLCGLFFLAGCGQPREDQPIYLIIHADDYGMTNSHNLATVEAIRSSLVNSASIMMPCAWAREGIRLMQEQEDLDMDMGIHLTLTNEWPNYRWRPVAPISEVSSLVNEEGLMYPDCATLFEHAKIEEVEKEMRAQIELALSLGLTPNHIDGHMSCIFKGGSEYVAMFIRVAQEYGLLPMVQQPYLEKLRSQNPKLLEGLDLEKVPKIREVLIANHEAYDEKGLSAYYSEILGKLKPGINILLIHTAFDDEEMRVVTETFDYWHAPWRQEDFDYFHSEAAYKLIKEKNIQLITWREVGEMMDNQ